MSLGPGKAKTERACALSWYSNWNIDQKNAFMQKISEKLSLESATDALLKDLEGLSMQQPSRTGEGPSVFECQLRIFDGWFKSWDSETKIEFVTTIFRDAGRPELSHDELNLLRR